MKDGTTMIFEAYILGKLRHITQVEEEEETKTYYLDGVVVSKWWKRILLGMWVRYKTKQILKFKKR